MEKTIQTKQLKRIEYIDMAKALGMLTIVWGHILLEGWSNIYVYSFHIPLFFFLSGMMFDGGKYHSLVELIKRRWKTLLLPYLMFSIVTWIIWAIVQVVLHKNVDIWNPLLQTFISQGSGAFMKHNLTLWFVTCLFVVEIAYYFINKLPQWANLLICVIISIVGVWIHKGGYIDVFRLLPWNIENATISLLFYAGGNLLVHFIPINALHDKVSSKKHLTIIGIIISTILLYFLAMYNGRVSVGSNIMGKSPALFYVNGFWGTFVCIALSIIICGISYKTKIFKTLYDYLQWFGCNSFFVMASHYPIKVVCSTIVMKICHVSAVSNSVKYSLITFIMVIAIDSLLVLYICKLKEKNHQWMVRKQKRD